MVCCIARSLTALLPDRRGGSPMYKEPDMKRKPLWILLILAVAAVVGFEVYMESHYTLTKYVPVPLSGERILEEMPDIAFTEADSAMAEALSASPEIADIPKSDIYTFPQGDAERLLAPYAPENCGSVELSAAGGNIYVSFFCGDRVINYGFDTVQTHREKAIGVHGKELVYSNTNGELAKTRGKRVLFAWLTKR